MYHSYMSRPRGWTDEQLVVAVAAARSWGDVVRKLGLSKSAATYRTVRGHAARMQLDVQHLPSTGSTVAILSNERIDLPPMDELARAVKCSKSWAGVLRLLGFDLSGSWYRRIQQAAGDLGIDASHFTGQGWNCLPVGKEDVPFCREAVGANLRKAASAIATAWFLRRGYMVSVPVEPAPYDLIVESDRGLVRIQVKSSATRTNGRWLLRIHRMEYDASVKAGANGLRTRRVYGAHEVDFFFAVTDSGDKYLIPLSATNGAESLTLDTKYAAYKLGE
jgi:hypothetical protein